MFLLDVVNSSRCLKVFLEMFILDICQGPNHRTLEHAENLISWNIHCPVDHKLCLACRGSAFYLLCVEKVVGLEEGSLKRTIAKIIEKVRESLVTNTFSLESRRNMKTELDKFMNGLLMWVPTDAGDSGGLCQPYRP